MLIYHTSDLHIGKTVNSFNLQADQHHILAQMLGHLRQVKPDAFIIAGDVYDKHIPGVEAVRLLDWFLEELGGMGTAVYIIAGNHDSSDRLCFASGLISHSKIFIEGGYTGQVATHTLQDEYGEVAFHLLPFFRPSLVNRYAEQDISNYDQAFAHLVAGLDAPHRRNVLIAHQFMVYQSDRPDSCESEGVGGTEAVEIAPAADFDYIALGHLHGPQKIRMEHIRYSGSPLKYSFSEQRHNKSMVAVQLGPKGQREMELIPLKSLHDMRVIEGPIADLTSAEVVADGDRQDYIHAKLTDEDAPDAMNRLRAVYPNIMSLEFDNARSNTRLEDISGGERLSLPEMFSAFYRELNGNDMDELQREMAMKLLDELGGGL